ncbi:MAG: outer membrane beta-barrel protein [Prevotella sp.]
MSTQNVRLYQVQDKDYSINRWNLTPSTNWNYSAELSYSEPIAQKTYLQFSYKFTNSYSKSDRSTYDFSDFSALPADYAHLLASLGINNIPDYRRWDYYVLSNYEDFYDQSVSRFSEYSNYTHDIELQFRRVRDNYNFNFGVLAQPQYQVFRQRYLSTTTDRARSVFNVSPTADFRYHFTKQHQLRFRYRGRTAQPSMESMLEITDNSDPMNITVGNPNLKPSFTNNFNLFYNNYITSYSRNILFGMGFSNTRNATVRSVAYDNVTGARTNTYQNINGNWNADVWAEYSQSLDSIGRWFVTTHPEYNYSNNVGLVALNRNADPQKSITRVHNIGERLSGSFRNSWLNVDIDGNVNYIHSTNDTQPSANLDTWSFAYGGSMQITLPWNTQLSTDMHMRSRRGYNDASLNTNELIWNIQLSQSFLRAKNLVVYLQFYDILQNQSNLTRVINERMHSDTEYNSINSFAMLRISYRFQTMGGKSSREHMRPTDGRPDFSRPEFRGSGGQHGSGGPPPVHGGGFGG